MSENEFHIFSIVEGKGEIEALPKLLNRICKSADCPFVLRMDREPHRVDNGRFFSNDNPKYRIEAFHRGAKIIRKYGNGCVLILMDADDSCCRKVLNDDNKMRGVRADINSILKDIPTLFVLAEKGYESWLVAGLGGTKREQNKRPSDWLTNNRGELGLLGTTYSKVPDQWKLTSSDKFDIGRAAKDNISFRRLRERVLAMARAASDSHS